MTEPKPKYKDINGKTRVGTALKWLLSQGKNVAPELLSVAGTITGLKGLELLGDKIRSNGKISPEDKEFLLEEIEFDKIEMQEVTKRWNSDMMSDSWLSKNIRPLVLAFLTLTLCIYIVLDSSILGFTVKNEWINLLSSLLLVVYGGYFGARTVEKITKNWNKKSL